MRIFEEICRALSLGSIIEPPRQLSGGFQHRMFSLFTERGKYAIKLLNPAIMARPDAMNNFRRAEGFERLLERTDIPILPALTFGGQKMQRIGDQYFYLFDWFDGRALPSQEITADHCRMIGSLLAKIHRIDWREEPSFQDALSFDWNFFSGKLSAVDAGLDKLYSECLKMLVEVQNRANAAISKLPPVRAICHGDLDSKNVLWQDGQPRIIDLECLGMENPFIELYETALYWSGIEQCAVDSELFGAFIGSYRDAGGVLPQDWKVIHDANTGRMGWLYYNLNRALEGEQALGVSESLKTLAQLKHYHTLRNTL